MALQIKDSGEATKWEEIKGGELTKGGSTHTIPAKLKGKRVLKTKKMVAPTGKELLADAQLQTLEDVRARFEAKNEEIYPILYLKYVSVECAKGHKRIKFCSLIKRENFKPRNS